MKTIKIANKEYIFAELATNQSWNPEFPSHLTWKSEDGGTYSEPYIMPIFDSDSWRKDTKIITTTNSITEEIAKTIIPKQQTLVGVIYPHYPLLEDFSSYYNEEHWASICDTALNSFYSLMDSLELDRNNKNYLLIEKL